MNKNLIFIVSKKYTIFYIVLLFQVFFISLLSYTTPYILRQIIDQAVPTGNLKLLSELVCILLIFEMVRNFLVYARSKLSLHFVFVIQFFIKESVMTALLQAPLRYLRQHNEGYWVGRINTDTSFMGSLLADQAINVLKNILIVGIGSFLLFQINEFVSILVLALLILNMTMSYTFGHLVKKRQPLLLEILGNLNGHMQNAFSWAPLSKVFMNHDRVISYWRKETGLFLAAYKPIINYVSYRFSIEGILSAITKVVILAIGAKLVIDGNMTIGQLVAYLSYYALVSQPAMGMMELITNMQRGLPALSRMNELINVKHDILDNESIVIDFLEYSNFVCSYDGEQKIVELKSVNLQKNHVIGLIGQSGCGKSCALMNMIGLYKPLKGSVKLDAHQSLSVDEVSALRNTAVYVEQEPLLLHDSIYDNIRLGKPDATEEEVRAASELAGVDLFVNCLPNGYHTVLGPGNNGVSVGEKQRIAIARALIRNPQLLILDEPTSNVDKQTEEIIFNSIRAFAKGRIVIVTSHNPAFLDYCDEVYEVLDGQVNIIL